MKSLRAYNNWKYVYPKLCFSLGGVVTYIPAERLFPKVRNEIDEKTFIWVAKLLSKLLFLNELPQKKLEIIFSTL